jgi:hypothetical protein
LFKLTYVEGTHSCAECKRRKIKCNSRYFGNDSFPGDRTEYSSYKETDACSQCKARGLASSCKPQYDPQDAPSPEPDSDLRDRVARLESALMSLTGRSSPGEVNLSSPRQHNYSNNVGTAVASGTNAASINQRSSYFTSSNDSLMNPALYSVFPEKKCV